LLETNNEVKLMPRHIHVLVVEDSVDDTFFIVRELQRAGFEVEFERVENTADMQDALASRQWDLIISDYRLPQFSGDAALELYKRSGQEAPFIMVSGAMSEETAVELLKSGAHDYVNKHHLGRLAPAVQQALQEADVCRLRRETESNAAFLASLVESCEDAIIGQKLDGTVVSWNAGAEELYGYTADEMTGRSVSVLFPTSNLDELPDLMARIGRGERIPRFETVRLRKNGSQVEVAVTYSPVKDPTGCIMGASVIARDISRRPQEEPERLSVV
jgi:two-component system, cell cycle sensor histidine kinase and response regulator CckA